MTKNIDTILAIIGVVATIVIGYLGVRYTLKYRKNTNIIFLKNSSISLFKNIVKNLDELEVNFKGKKIDDNLIIFKGTFFNNGNVDIDKSIIHKPLEIELPKNYYWVNQKIIGSSEGLNANLEKNENKLVFNWDLLKEGEYITFESLVEYKSDTTDDKSFDISKKLLKEINFNHRITNLKRINKEGSIPKPMSLGGFIFISFVILLLVIPGYYVSIGQYLFPNYQIYNEVTIDSEQQFVKSDVKDENKIILISDSGNELKTVSPSQLNEILGNEVLIKKKEINYWILIIVGLFSTIYFIAYIILIAVEIRERRLYKKLKNVAKKHNDIDFEERRQIGIKLFEFRFK